MKEKARFITHSSTALVIATICWGATVVAQRGELVSVDDPRPLAAAIRRIEVNCRCVITYEDPMWRSDEVVDISGTIAHRSDIRPRVPRGGLFSYTIDANIASYTQAQMKGFLERVIGNFESSGSGHGTFQLTSNGATFHVVPRVGSVLDVPVTLPGGSRAIIDVISTITAQAAHVKGQRIAMGALPFRVLQKQVELSGDHDSARVLLDRVLFESGRKLSWRLFYDYTMAKYYFSIHLVE